MGITKIRRLCSSENKWTDKSCERHKHNFIIPCTVILTGNENKHIRTSYYNAIKCEHCNSFIKAKFIKEPLNTKYTLTFQKPHFAIGFCDIKLVECKENNYE